MRFKRKPIVPPETWMVYKVQTEKVKGELREVKICKTVLDYRIVEAEDLDELLDSGWFKFPLEAIEDAKKKAADAPKPAAKPEPKPEKAVEAPGEEKAKQQPVVTEKAHGVFKRSVGRPRKVKG